MSERASPKPVDLLTLADFEAAPLWEFAEGEEEVEDRDETWVQPSPDMRLLRRVPPYAVRAEFTTATGKQVLGVAWVTTMDSLEVASISLFPDGAYTSVPMKGHWLEGDVRERLAIADIVFPLAFKLSVRPSEDAMLAEGVFE